MKFRKKPVVIDAVQWHQNGDHPEDNCETFKGSDGKPSLSEGEVVRYYRHPAVPSTDSCAYCTRMFHDHGWIDTLEGGHIVCPGDFVITGVKGERYPCKPDIFAATYDEIEELETRVVPAMRGVLESTAGFLE